ncbi:MAG: flagellar biosynthetic protein FliO [Anaerolineaceae bacterium]|nr:flagellar biosynthetic protein FliO [Anaerolineaceae bacterium]
MITNLLNALKSWFVSCSPKKKQQTLLMALGIVATCALLILTGSSDGQNDSLAFTPLYYLSVFIKLIGVLLLFVGGAVIFRRWQKSRNRGVFGRQLAILESVRLSPKQALHLVRVGDQHLLIGATDQAVALISSVTIDEKGSEESLASSEQAFDFSSLFKKVSQQQESPSLAKIEEKA